MIMDVDAPNLLKRSSSAPLINEASTSATSPTTNTAPRSTLFSMLSSSQSRPRRNSATCGATASIGIINPWGPRMAPRVNQLRAEECADLSNTREVAHERQVHDAMQMGQSCEDLNLMPGLSNSPTRTPVRFSPSVVSPSPPRKFLTRRSLSPIAPPTFSVGRPTMLVAKRRCDEPDSPLSKRMCTSDRLTPSTPGTPDSDSLECTFRPVSPRVQHMESPQNSFRPVSPRAQPMIESPHSEDIQVNHKLTNPS